MAAVMNHRGFVTPPWIETTDRRTWTVVVEALNWNAHDRYGWSTHRRDFDSLDGALWYLGRLGFTIDTTLLDSNPTPLEA